LIVERDIIGDMSAVPLNDVSVPEFQTASATVTPTERLQCIIPDERIEVIFGK
jgi:hypothetical protein